MERKNEGCVDMPLIRSLFDCLQGWTVIKMVRGFGVRVFGVSIFIS